MSLYLPTSLELLFFIILLYFVYRFIKYIKFRKTVNQFPGFNPNFIFGDVFQFDKDRIKLFKKFREFARKFPIGYRICSGYYPVFCLLKPEDIEVILSSTRLLNKYNIYYLLTPWLKEGLLTSDNPKWKQRRRILTPTFHFNILRKFVDIFDKHCKVFVKDLQKECKKSKTNVVPLATKLTLELICETSMGISLNSEDKTQKEYINALHNLAALVIDRLFQPWFYTSIYYLFPSGIKHNKYLKILHNFTTNVIKEREKTFNENEITNMLNSSEDDYEIYSKNRFAMLDLLLLTKNTTGEIDFAGIREEVDTFMFEGHDTTATALIYIILMLATHKDLQKKVVQEIDKVFHDYTQSLTYQDLQKLTYLEMFIKESLRLYPPVPLISRTLTEDVVLRNGKYTFPEGSIIAIQIYDLHHDPKIYPDPEIFDPERFSLENCLNRHPYAYIPFSAGPRNCIGQRFAMLELKSVITSILRNYEIDPVDKPEDIHIKIDLVLRPENGVYVKFKPRQ